MTDTVLVTGGAGFIGSHLCDALRRAGRRVRVLDDLSSGSRSNLPPDVDLVMGDVADRTAVARALKGVDACFHLAAIASVERGVRDWVGTHRVNLTGTIVLLDAVRAHPVPVVYASSAAVYGDGQDLPLDEDAAKRPLSAYGADKYGCELHAAVATRVHGIPTTGLRFFNVYGPRQDPGSPYSGVISIFCDRLARGKPVDVFGDGLQTRDFIYVDDVVQALLRALDRPAATGPDVFNVCSGNPVSILDLGREIAGLAGTHLRVRHGPARAGDIRHSVGSPSRARVAFGARKLTPLRDGLAATLGWLAQSRRTATSIRGAPSPGS